MAKDKTKERGTLKIILPKVGDIIPADTFGTFGKAKGVVGKVTGELWKDGASAYTGETRTTPGDRRWVVVFHGVADGDYTLRVQGDNADAVERNFTVKKAKKIKSVSVISPNQNQTVCNTFFSMGSSTGAAAISGELEDTTTAALFTGTTLFGPPTYCIQFSSVPNGTYNLTVYDADGNDATVTGVHVNQMYC